MAIERRHWVLLASWFGEGHQIRPVQLQKALFLVGEQVLRKHAEFYQFVPYDYGPFSKDIYRDADELAADGLLKVVERAGTRGRKYSLTSDGIRTTGMIRSDAPAEAVRYLSDVVTWTQSLSFPDLLKAIYAQYPEYKSRSVFADSE